MSSSDVFPREWKEDMRQQQAGGGSSSSTSSPFVVETLSLYESSAAGLNTGKEPRRNKPTLTTTTAKTVRKAVLEVPLQASPEKGLALAKTTRMSAFSSFSLGGRWSGSVSGTSEMRGRTGYSTALLNTSYQVVGSSSLQGGLSIGEKTNVQLGGTARAAQSHVTASVSVPPTDPSGWRACVTAGSQRFRWCTIRSTFSFLPSSAAAAAAIAQPANVMLSLATKTAHRIELGMGWSRLLKQPLLSIAIHPVGSNNNSRQLSLSAQVRGLAAASWQLGLVWTQTLQSAAIIGVGVQHASSRGITWILTWTHGDLTVRVPVIVSSVAEPVWNPVLYLYMAFLSQAVQETVAHVLGLGSDGDAEQEKIKLQEQQDRLNRQKTREDAEQQQNLMKRQATSRIAQEKEKGGLVVHRAVYWVNGGETLDVTIPLQFWVSESSLMLPESSKGELLGFCKVSREESKDKEEEGTGGGWWAGFWTVPKGKEASPGNTPKLTVKYNFGGQSYEITVQDYASLSLPSSRAFVVPP